MQLRMARYRVPGGIMSGKVSLTNQDREFVIEAVVIVFVNLLSAMIGVGSAVGGVVVVVLSQGTDQLLKGALFGVIGILLTYFVMKGVKKSFMKLQKDWTSTASSE